MRFPSAVACSLVVSLLSCLPLRAEEESATTAQVPAFPTREAVGEAINEATAYLLSQSQEDGSFVYRRHVNPKRIYAPKYNLLRHAGAIYSLVMAYNRKPSPRVLEVINKASLYLAKQTGAIQASPDAIAVWSPPTEETQKTGLRIAKLGGAGLALVSMGEYKKITPNSVPDNLLEGLGHFVLYMQKPDGGFHSKYAELGERYFFDKWTSLYYPGEAMLGLMNLYELNNNRLWLDTTARGLAYLAKSRERSTLPPADHWALLATEKFAPLLPTIGEPPITEEALFAHASQICERMIAEQHTLPGDIYGCYNDRGLTCPSAIRLEGLLASYAVLPEGYGGLKFNISQSAHIGIGFLIRTQLRSGLLKGGIPRAFLKTPHDVDSVSPKSRNGEIRIDYVQHALSALIRYEKIFFPSENNDAAPPSDPVPLDPGKLQQ